MTGITIGLVTVILPVFGSRSILRSIISIQNQTYTNFECFIVDDGSIVAELESHKTTVQSINDPRFQLFHYPVNKGAGAARQYGIGKASGEIITFLDSDDYWQPTYLEAIIFIHNKYPSFPVVSTSWALHPSPLHTLMPSINYRLPGTVNISSPFLLPRLSCPTCSIKSSYITVPFADDLRYAEELFFFLANLLKAKKKLVTLKCKLVTLNRSPGSRGGLSYNKEEMYASAHKAYLKLKNIYTTDWLTLLAIRARLIYYRLMYLICKNQ